MKTDEAMNLTRIMRDNAILRIGRFTDAGRDYFNVAMEGDVLGTGLSVEEAYQSALRQKSGRAAA